VNCSQWQEWQDVGYVTALFMLPYMENNDQARRPDTVTVPVTLDVTITAPVMAFSMSTIPFEHFSTPATHSRNDASQYCQCRTQHAGDVDRHAQRVSDDAYHQSPCRACRAPTFHIWSK